MLVLRAYKSKANFENVATGIKKENLLLTHYSHVLPALKEVKHVSRIFNTWFDNKKLKNETRELAKSSTTGVLTFRKSLLIMWEITIFALAQSSCLFKNFPLRNEDISNVYLKVDNLSYNFFREETSHRYFKSL